MVAFSQSSSRRSKEHCLYSCGSFGLHVWKNVSIAISGRLIPPVPRGADKSSRFRRTIGFVIALHSPGQSR